MEGNKGLLRCKIVVVGDTECGKTALLHVFAKDSYPENYVPTVFENYTASFEIEKQRIELNMWDTSVRRFNAQRSINLHPCRLQKDLLDELQIKSCRGRRCLLVCNGLPAS
ncbi:hypothetical protein NQZ68_039965 [Dissostichus eleginoides]|nr:hypothetical protein NQZ68_039965 [Dissostichus eleginoides]